jgi:hypothetical protein
MTRLQRKSVAAVAALGALALVATSAAAHGTGQGGYGAGQGGYGPGMGMMMGPGYGPGGMGMRGPAGYGMMGQAYGHGPIGTGMMGPGYGMAGQAYGNAPCGQAAAQTDQDLDIGDVQARLERWLSMQGNDRLKLGKIEAVDDDTITAEIVTVDDSLVRKLAVDRHSGQMQPAK